MPPAATGTMIRIGFGGENCGAAGSTAAMQSAASAALRMKVRPIVDTLRSASWRRAAQARNNPHHRIIAGCRKAFERPLDGCVGEPRRAPAVEQSVGEPDHQEYDDAGEYHVSEEVRAG